MDTAHRIAELRKFMEEKGIALSDNEPEYQFYVSGFRAVIYYGPIDDVLTSDKTVLIVPGLEEAHHEASVDEVLVYYEHPEMADRGKTHLDHLDRIDRKLVKGSKVGVEVGAAPYGLVEHLKAEGLESVDVGQKIKEMRFVRDEAEIALMVEVGRLLSLAVKSSLEALRLGISEIELDAQGIGTLFAEVAARHPGASLDLFVMSPTGAESSVMPHVFSST